MSRPVHWSDLAVQQDENVREVLENPYRILYLAQPSRVDILAIVHGRQDITWPK